MVLKFIIISLLYFVFLLNIQCNGKSVRVEVKIKNDWEGKREFIYLKNVEANKRFVVKKIEKRSNRYANFSYNIEGFLRPVSLNIKSNTFTVELAYRSRDIPSIQMNKRIVIEIVNNQNIQRFLPGFENQV